MSCGRKIGNVKPGVYNDMRFADYLAEPAMSASKLKLLYRSYRDYEKGLKQSTSMKSGRLEHLAVLEPEKYDKIVVVVPEKRINEKGKEVKFVRTGGHWEEFQRSNLGKIIVSSTEDEQCRLVADAVHENHTARRYLTGDKEVSIFWEDQRFGPAKARFDCINTHGRFIADLKRTAKDLDRFGFTCDSLGYDIQSSWYLSGAKAVGIDVQVFYFIAYESSWPHDSSVQETPLGMLESGAAKIDVAFDNFKKAASGEFTGKIPGVTVIDFPVSYEEDF